MDDQRIAVRFLEKTEDMSVLPSVHNDFGDQTGSYFIPRGKTIEV
jgi:hypothetical protein